MEQPVEDIVVADRPDNKDKNPIAVRVAVWLAGALFSLMFFLAVASLFILYQEGVSFSAATSDGADEQTSVLPPGQLFREGIVTFVPMIAFFVQMMVSLGRAAYYATNNLQDSGVARGVLTTFVCGILNTVACTYFFFSIKIQLFGKDKDFYPYEWACATTAIGLFFLVVALRFDSLQLKLETLNEKLDAIVAKKQD